MKESSLPWRRITDFWHSFIIHFLVMIFRAGRINGTWAQTPHGSLFCLPLPPQTLLRHPGRALQVRWVSSHVLYTSRPESEIRGKSLMTEGTTFINCLNKHTENLIKTNMTAHKYIDIRKYVDISSRFISGLPDAASTIIIKIIV